MYAISIPSALWSESNLIVSSLDKTIFCSVELQGSLLLEKGLLNAIAKKKLFIVNGYDFIKNSVITNSLDQSETFQEDVCSTIQNLLIEPIYQNLMNVTIDFGLFKNHDDPKFFSFIKKLYYHLNLSNKNICLPVTLPGMKENSDIIKKVFYKLMLYKFRICLNIYPHEISRDEDFSFFFQELSNRIEVIRISYDASYGNYITPKLFEFWKEKFRKYELDNKIIIFAPMVKTLSMLEEEALKLAELVKTHSPQNSEELKVKNKQAMLLY